MFEAPGLSSDKQESDLDKVCRSCLGKNGEMRSLFDACLDEMLRKVADIQVDISDGLPELICFQCVLQVSRAFRFKQQCQNSDRILRARFNRSLHEKSDQEIEDNVQDTEIADCFEPSEQNLDSNVASVMTSDFSTSSIIESFDTINEKKIDEDHFVGKEDLSMSCRILEEFLVETDEPNTVEMLNTVEENIDLNTQLSIPETKKQSVDYTFECNVCYKTFTKKHAFRRHLKIHDPIKAHVCKECNMSFTESSNLTKHMKRHTGELRNITGKPNLCTVCGKAFKWASSLSKHMNRHTKKKVLQCPHCPKFYLERQTLKLHIRTHTGEKPFVCNICEKSFTQMCNLEKHLRVHTGEKPYKCPVCDKGFTQSSYIAIHMRSHTGEKPYMCVECGKCFAGSNTLAMHKRTHTGEKPYGCNICGMTFARLETATVHQRTHTGEKPHCCPICDRAFKSSSLLSNHKRTHVSSNVSHQDQISSAFRQPSQSLR